MISKRLKISIALYVFVHSTIILTDYKLSLKMKQMRDRAILKAIIRNIEMQFNLCIRGNFQTITLLSIERQPQSRENNWNKNIVCQYVWRNLSKMQLWKCRIIFSATLGFCWIHLNDMLLFTFIHNQRISPITVSRCIDRNSLCVPSRQLKLIYYFISQLKIPRYSF